MSTLPLMVCNPLLVKPALFFWLIKSMVAPVRSLIPLKPVISLPQDIGGFRVQDGAVDRNLAR